MRPGLGGLEAPVVGEGVVQDEELEAGDVHLVDLLAKGGDNIRSLFMVPYLYLSAFMHCVLYNRLQEFFFVWRFSGNEESFFRRL